MQLEASSVIMASYRLVVKKVLGFKLDRKIMKLIILDFKFDIKHYGIVYLQLQFNSTNNKYDCFSTKIWEKKWWASNLTVLMIKFDNKIIDQMENWV